MMKKKTVLSQSNLFEARKKVNMLLQVSSLVMCIYM
jgi:hypothetical protein